VTLTPSGTITTDTAGDVVSNFDITGGEAITTPTMTPENCRVKATSRGGIVVQALGAVIENCADPNGGTRGVPFDDPATGGVVRGRDTHEAEDHDVEDGVFISITDIVMEDNYIYDLKSTGFDPHHNSRWRHERRPT
jgi:hypothetical protein